MFFMNIVFQTPFGPRKMALSHSSMKVRLNSSSIAWRSMLVGHFQSNRSMALKDPMLALRRRRSRLRRLRSASSMSSSCSIQGWEATSGHRETRPKRPKRCNRDLGVLGSSGSLVFFIVVAPVELVVFGKVVRFDGGVGDALIGREAKRDGWRQSSLRQATVEHLSHGSHGGQIGCDRV